MKQTKTIFLALLSIAALIACSGKKESDSDSGSRTWEAMDSYHMIMAESFHPVKDSMNLAPAKANAEALASEAEKWASSELPKRVDNDEMKAMLEGIKVGSRAFADMVKAGASDEELAGAMTALHDGFHKVMEAWEGGAAGHEGHH